MPCKKVSVVREGSQSVKTYWKTASEVAALVHDLVWGCDHAVSRSEVEWTIGALLVLPAATPVAPLVVLPGGSRGRGRNGKDSEDLRGLHDGDGGSRLIDWLVGWLVVL